MNKEAKEMAVPENVSAWTTAITATSIFVRAGVDALIPPSCVLCAGANLDDAVVLAEKPHSPLVRLCEPCKHAITHSWPPRAISCRYCGMPRPNEPVSSLEFPCASCPETAFQFDEVLSLAIYQQAVREAVVAAKLSKHSSLAVALGWLLGDLVASRLHGKIPDRITCVPSHFARRIQRRGLGGVATMAMAVAKRLSQSYEPTLRLTRHVTKQSMLPDADRAANVRGAFAVKKSYAWQSPQNLRDQHILLVDDVLTTGSTASEIAGVLKAAGAASVTLAVVARAVRR